MLMRFLNFKNPLYQSCGKVICKMAVKVHDLKLTNLSLFLLGAKSCLIKFGCRKPTDLKTFISDNPWIK